MKIYLFYILLIFTISCSDKKSGYALIRDNLYSDKGGNLYLKSENNEDLENGTKYDVWLKEVYCDTCGTPTENGLTDITELKDFVDPQTWRYDTSNGYWTEYIDKKYRYHHTHMADGGTIRLEEVLFTIKNKRY